MARKMYEIAFELAGKMNSSFSRSFMSADERMGKMNREMSEIRTNIRYLEKAQKAGTISNKTFAKSYDLLTQKLQKTERAQKKYAKAVNLQQKAGEFRQNMRGRMLGAVETAAVIGTPAVAAIRFESSMADVKKVVDFDTPKQFEEMGKDIIDLTTKKRIPMLADQIGQIVAAGGQAGIGRDGLIDFAESAAKMGVAFDTTAEEAGQTMAQWRSAFKMNQEQVNTLADQINYLGNTTAASAPKISGVVRRIGPLGEVGGAAASEIAALGASMVSSGIQEEIAATGIKNLILTLTSGEAATKSQQKAFKSLGLDAGNMAKMMQDDAQGAILVVLDALKQLPKHKQAAVMSDLFGKESIAAISPLLTNMDALKQNLDKVGDSTQYAGSMEKEFQARSETTENQLLLLKNNANALGITLGSILLPPIVTLSDKFSKAAEKVQSFAEKHPGLAKVLVLGAASVLGFTVAMAGLGYATSIIISPFINFYAWTRKAELAEKLAAARTKAWTGAKWLWNKAMLAGRGLLSVGRLVLYYTKSLAISAATKAWTAAQWLWNAAMSANPIGLMIVGIGALIGAGYMLVKNWGTVKEWFVTLWNNPREAVDQFVAGAREKFSGIFEWFEGKITWLGEKWDWLKEKGGGLLAKFTGDDGEGTATASIPRHAKGGVFNKPHLAWFAEKGPEAAIPLDGSEHAISLWKKVGKLLGISTHEYIENNPKKATPFSKESATQSIPGHAKGGVFNKPHLAWFAEKDEKNSISLDRSTCAVSLWNKTSDEQGTSSSVATEKDENQIIYSPTYNIYAKDKEVVEQVKNAAKSSQKDFAKLLKEFTHQKRRLCFD